MKVILFICIVGLSLASDKERKSILGFPKLEYKPFHSPVVLDPNDADVRSYLDKTKTSEIVKVLRIIKSNDRSIWEFQKGKPGTYYLIEYLSKMVGKNQLYRCHMDLYVPKSTDKSFNVESNSCHKTVPHAYN